MGLNERLISCILNIMSLRGSGDIHVRMTSRQPGMWAEYSRARWSRLGLYIFIHVYPQNFEPQNLGFHWLLSPKKCHNFPETSWVVSNDVIGTMVSDFQILSTAQCQKLVNHCHLNHSEWLNFPMFVGVVCLGTEVHGSGSVFKPIGSVFLSSTLGSPLSERPAMCQWAQKKDIWRKVGGPLVYESGNRFQL